MIEASPERGEFSGGICFVLLPARLYTRFENTSASHNAAKKGTSSKVATKIDKRNSIYTAGTLFRAANYELPEIDAICDGSGAICDT